MFILKNSGHLAAFLLFVIVPVVLSDTPANCTYEDIRGKWMFYVGHRSDPAETGKMIDCSKLGDVTAKYEVTLLYPNIAVDGDGNQGFWTIIYNQGFEVVIRGRKFFAFSAYTEDGTGTATSDCEKTLPGWSHDVLGNSWACFQGNKITSNTLRFMARHSVHPINTVKKVEQDTQRYRPNPEYIKKINSIQSTWTAVHYKEYEDMSLEQLMARAGGRKTHVSPKPAEASEEVKKAAAALPKSMDWRNVNGVNYVSPVRNQGACGSCYSFSSAGMLECRIRVMTGNKQQPVLSPMDIVQCSKYSQGCDGGFPYLIAGKYAEDFGFVDENCNPYNVNKSKESCQTDHTCQRYYGTNYRYVGGYYGATNEEEMMLALVAGGPLSISFEVTGDFFHYKGGIYQSTKMLDKFNPFELTNHAVLLVGYGVDDDTGTPFWIVKNSWGETWGEDGYFRIVRGVNELAIESESVEVTPIPHL